MFCFLYFIIFVFNISRGIQHPLPPPLALDVEVLAKRKTKKFIGLMERHLNFYRSRVKSPMAGRAATVEACSPETSNVLFSEIRSLFMVHGIEELRGIQ